ncbi:MAG: DNA-3-methyladenine glycosylase 2 family protein [Lachnospiraceae bacterium]|nr:DNA-3-methyladenine glycosylase 2 family protein [Lachnospiraceae bacterium]
MIELDIPCFDLRAIMESGQVFRMYEREENRFDIYAGSRHLKAVNDGSKVLLFCEKAEYEAFWRNYFDIDRDYAGMIERVRKACRENGFLLRAALECSGIRVLKQDLFEMLITFIISQQKQIPSIRRCVEALCERLGQRIDEDGGYYAFPTPKAIACAGLEGLDGLSLGYRQPYIYESAVRYLEEGVSEGSFAEMSYEQSKEFLKSFRGVGEKVANCICLFALHKVEAFPVDTHVKDILFREFYDGGLAKDRLRDSDYAELVRERFKGFDDIKGILQQWMFAYEIKNGK